MLAIDPWKTKFRGQLTFVETLAVMRLGPWLPLQGPSERPVDPSPRPARPQAPPPANEAPLAVTCKSYGVVLKGKGYTIDTATAATCKAARAVHGCTLSMIRGHAEISIQQRRGAVEITKFSFD
jgi:hypothetical protein